ncbi:MAG: hypothetical protein R2748_07580 [Bryobacterales bacterium]
MLTIAASVIPLNKRPRPETRRRARTRARRHGVEGEAGWSASATPGPAALCSNDQEASGVVATTLRLTGSETCPATPASISSVVA